MKFVSFVLCFFLLISNSLATMTWDRDIATYVDKLSQCDTYDFNLRIAITMHRRSQLTNPPVGHHSDEVLRWQRLEHWHKELDQMLVFCEFTANGKHKFALSSG